MITEGEWCVITRDIKVGDFLAFKKDEIVHVEAVSPHPNMPESKNVVFSESYGKRFQLSDKDLRIAEQASPEVEDEAERTDLRPESASNQQTMYCMNCGQPVNDEARYCEHCGTERGGASKESSVVSGTSTGELLGTLMVIVPFCSALIAYFWIGNMTLLEGPSSKLAALTVITVLATSVLATIEAYQYDTKPLEWFFLMVLLWIFVYPAYLYHRKDYGRRNLLVAGIVVAIIFVAVIGLLWYAIESKKTEVLNIFR